MAIFLIISIVFVGLLAVVVYALPPIKTRDDLMAHMGVCKIFKL